MSSCSILLVDDGEELRDLLRHVLERAGHLVTCAKNGIDASSVITGGSFDAVVTDMLMPGSITGCDLELLVRILPVNIRVRVRLGLLMDMQAGLPSLR